MEEETTNNKETINNDAPEEKKTFMHYIKILYIKYKGIEHKQQINIT